MRFFKPLVIIAFPVAVILILSAVLGTALSCCALNEMLE